MKYTANNQVLYLLFFFITIITSCGFLKMGKLQNNFFITESATLKNFLETTKFRLDGWIYVNTELNQNGNKHELIFDTGSPSFISFKAKDSLNIQSKKVIRFGKMKIDECVMTVQLGNLIFNDSKFLVLNHGIAGLLGVNVMQHYIWSINFEDSTLSITDNLDSLDIELTDAYKISFEPYSEQKTPVVKLVVNNADTVEAFIDSGYGDYILFNKTFNTETIKKENPDNIAVSTYSKQRSNGTKTINESHEIRINSLRIGNFEATNTVVVKGSLYDGKNLIGMKFLRNFIVTIDWLHSDIYLKPIEGRKLIDNIATYGFTCYKDSNFLKVTYVYSDSPASKQGIQSDDEIIRVNNQEIKDLPVNVVEMINNKEMSDIKLLLTIKNKEQNISLSKYNVFK
jgi:hypothetical protein